MAQLQGGAGSDWWRRYQLPQQASTSRGPITVLSFEAGVAPGPFEAAAEVAAVALAEARENAARSAAAADAVAALYSRPPVPYYMLRDGTRMPAVGLGTWKAAPGDVRHAVNTALQAGYRHIDCAAVYANEEEVGDALQLAISRGLPRSELYICSKVWNPDHSAARVRSACQKSLAALRLDYLDLYLIHWPVTGSVGPELKPSTRETWQAMEGLVREGLVRSIGVSNFGAKKLADILSYATIPPAVCQVEVHPYHRNDALIAWCRQHDIHVTAFSPLGSPDSASIFPRKPLVLMEDETVKAVAQRTGKNVGQVLIRWALQHGTSVIPKSTSPARIRGNLAVFDWALGAEDYAALSTLRSQQRMVNGAMWLHPRGPYRTQEELWDEPELDD